MKLNMDEARRRDLRLYEDSGLLMEALADIDTLLERLKGLLVAAENHARVHQGSSAMPLLLNFEMEQARKLLDDEPS